MNKQQFWQLIEAARNQASNPNDGEAVAREATSLLASRPAEEIVAAEQVLWDLMVDSCSNPLWAAACLANGGCSDDGFDYFRGWLIAQGCEVFERVVADPDALAELPIVQASAADGVDLAGIRTVLEEQLGDVPGVHPERRQVRTVSGAIPRRRDTSAIECPATDSSTIRDRNARA
ncbi:DUF4240 domain-containing protein [Streptomyces avidinii]|uniref:DUF4240 domain-containing protein n=1 Tax=Streptomyces avidinii TaxID=1895 RepID=UPI0037AE6A47